MKKAFFFDVDDTLVNSGFLHEKAFLKTISDLGIIAPKFSYSQFEGFRTEEVFAHYIRDESLIKNASELKREFFRDLVGQVNSNLGAMEILEYLHHEKRKIFAVSSGSSKSVRASLVNTGLLKWFNGVITYENTVNSKPHPDPYLLAIKQSGLKEGDCLAIEDSENGLKSALSAGLETVLIRADTPDWVAKYDVKQFESLVEFREKIEGTS
jgi:HAD superfamily hydrolase (TIGR01509 family)